MSKNVRLVSLDGLRGLAAVVVLVHHAALLNPSLARPYFVPGESLSGVSALLVYSPLHLGWAGTEAVYLFFVMSGLVLTLPRVGSQQVWTNYLPARLVRLYGPVLFAVVFAWSSSLLVGRDGPVASPWLANHPEYDVSSIIRDLTVVEGVSGVITPLWSLVWEVLFSLFLPLYLFIGDRVRPFVLAAAASVLLLIGALTGSMALTYLPMFAIGVALAYAWRPIGVVAEAIERSRFRWPIWLLAIAVSITLALSYWLLGTSGAYFAAPTRLLITLGVAGIVLVVCFVPALRDVFSISPMRWLGRISFSLYLTHEPVVVAMGFLLPERPRVAGLLALGLAVPIAWGFYRLVERPIHRVSQRMAGNNQSAAVEYRAAVVPRTVTGKKLGLRSDRG